MVAISQTTGYPWDNLIKIQIDPEKSESFDLKLRIPCWAREKVMESDLYRYPDKMKGTVSLKVNGKETPFKLVTGYAVLNRAWEKGDLIELSLPMEVRFVVANEKVAEDKGKVAIECGPIVYCAEGVDNAVDIFSVIVPNATKFTKEFKKDFLGSVPVITAKVPYMSADNTSTGETQLTLIPYYTWSNRGPGKMTVWFPSK